MLELDSTESDVVGSDVVEVVSDVLDSVVCAFNSLLPLPDKIASSAALEPVRGKGSEAAFKCHVMAGSYDTQEF